MNLKFEEVRAHILDQLSKRLTLDLTYHNIEHVLDVEGSATRLARMEDITDRDIVLIRTAALFHDSGMMNTYHNHEEEGCKIASMVLPEYGYSRADIQGIKDMIMATKLPQTAKSLPEKIICDADLDYLGRIDFFMIAHRLKYEWNILNINTMELKEWYLMQEEFLSKHRYYTNAAQVLRDQQKKGNLNQIIELLNNQ